MSEIQDEAYTEACEEIDRLKFLNAEERKTIEELSGLCLRAADALERTLGESERFESSMQAFIAQLRTTASL